MEIKINSQDFFVMKVKGSKCYYEVNYLDGEYFCECSIHHKRNYKIECKHIKEVKEWLKENHKQMHLSNISNL